MKTSSASSTLNLAYTKYIGASSGHICCAGGCDVNLAAQKLYIEITQTAVKNGSW